MYTQTQGSPFIVRISDGANIPSDPDNRDYQQYLVWEADQKAQVKVTEIPLKMAKKSTKQKAI